jgi:hypothetical protein
MAMPGYDAKDKKWFKKCTEGVFTLPPEDEMGMAWLEGFFLYVDTVKCWYWEAADVTRVTADSKYYVNMRTALELRKYEHREGPHAFQ